MKKNVNKFLHKDFVYRPGNPQNGVRIEKDGLLWYQDGSPGWAHGVAKTQSFDDFIQKGPEFSGLSMKMLAELIAIVQEITGKEIVWIPPK